MWYNNVCPQISILVRWSYDVQEQIKEKIKSLLKYPTETESDVRIATEPEGEFQVL